MNMEAGPESGWHDEGSSSFKIFRGIFYYSLRYS